jgi:hypothetical protein
MPCALLRALRGDGRAARTAVDPGRGNRDVEPAVETGVATPYGAVAMLEISYHGRVCLTPRRGLLAEIGLRRRTWHFPASVAPSGRRSNEEKADSEPHEDDTGDAAEQAQGAGSLRDQASGLAARDGDDRVNEESEAGKHRPEE